MAEPLSVLLNPQQHGISGADGADLYNNTQPVVPRQLSMIAAQHSQQFRGAPSSLVATTTESGSGSASDNDKRWGYVSPIGNRFIIDDSSGSEKIELVHHTGAYVAIDPDGTIILAPASRRGIVVSASRGDAAISAVGTVIIDGRGEIDIQTSGDINMTSGGNINITADGAVSINSRAFNQHVEGSSTRTIVEDASDIIGGLYRQTIAGDARTQVSGNNMLDVGDTYTQRVANSIVVAANNYAAAFANGYTIDCGAQFAVVAGGLWSVDSAGVRIRSSDPAAIDIDGGLSIDSADSVAITAGSTINYKAVSSFSVTSPSVAHSESAVSAPTIDATETPTAPAAADVVDPIIILDTVTTRRADPQFPVNALQLHADYAAIREQQ